MKQVWPLPGLRERQAAHCLWAACCHMGKVGMPDEWRGWAAALAAACTGQTANTCYSAADCCRRSWHHCQSFSEAVARASCLHRAYVHDEKGWVRTDMLSIAVFLGGIVSLPDNEFPSLSRTLHHSAWTLGTSGRSTYLLFHIHLLLDCLQEIQSQVFCRCLKSFSLDMASSSCGHPT